MWNENTRGPVLKARKEGEDGGKKTEKKQLEKPGVDERKKVTPNGEMSTRV